MKLRFTRTATKNLTEISNYLIERNPAAALRVRGSIYQGLKDLLLFPNAGRAQSVAGVRKFVTHRYSYLIYYKIAEEAQEIVILSVKHPAQGREHDDA